MSSNVENNTEEMSLLQLTERLSSNSELAKARIILPDPNELEITLVDLNLVKRLDEIKSDMSLYQNVLFTAIGALIGAITSIVFSEKPNSSVSLSAYIFISFFVIIIVLLAILLVRYNNRLKPLKKKLLKRNYYGSE